MATRVRKRVLPGISGLSLYLPPYRVQLQDWCTWNDESWDKTRSVVGRSFRMRGPAQSVYTLAANAVLRLIEDYDVDPTRIGMLAPDNATAVEAAYLSIFTRRPTVAEADHFTGLLTTVKSNNSRSNAMSDLYWTLMNATEFSWNH